MHSCCWVKVDIWQCIMCSSKWDCSVLFWYYYMGAVLGLRSRPERSTTWRSSREKRHRHKRSFFLSPPSSDHLQLRYICSARCFTNSFSQLSETTYIFLPYLDLLNHYGRGTVYGHNGAESLRAYRFVSNLSVWSHCPDFWYTVTARKLKQEMLASSLLTYRYLQRQSLFSRW